MLSRKFIFLTLSFFFVVESAFSACPKVGGKYVCGTDSNGEDNVIVIRQKKKKFTWEAGGWEVSYTLGDWKEIFGADEGQTGNSVRTKASCSDDTVFLDMGSFFEGQLVRETKLQISPTKDGIVMRDGEGQSPVDIVCVKKK